MENCEKIIWRPSADFLQNSYAAKLMKIFNAKDRDTLWQKSVKDISAFWDITLKDLGIEWFKPYEKVLDNSEGIESSHWFLGGKINLTHNCVDRNANRSNPAILWEGDSGEVRNLSYQEFFRQVNQTANALKVSGIGVGDTVGILMPMVPEVVVQLFACFKIGAVAIPIFSGFGTDAIASRLKESRAKLLFTSDVSFRRGKKINVKAVADEAIENLPELKTVIVFNHDNQTQKLNAKDRWWHEFVLSQPTDGKTESLNSEDPCLILFTSGTTGKPKGAIHTHAGCLAQIGKELRYAFNVDESSRFFWFTDIGWMMGPWEMIGVTLFGGTLFLYEGAPDFPTPERLWQIIERHQITTLGISPTAIRLLMKAGAEPPQKYELKSLKLLGSTGEPWDPESYQWFFKWVGKEKCPIINISGGTEIIGCLLSPLPIEPLKPCSLGGPALGVDADVFDENGNSVRGGIGHLVCKQPIPSMTKGFLNSRERYLETYFSRWPGVWFHGDWAHIDAEGFWFLHGRSDDTIKIGGKRIGPVEFESVLLKNPAVSEAAAVGVPDAIKGESCVAYAVLKPGVSANEDLRTALTQEVSKAVGKALALKELKFTSQLPKTRSAKILRGLIRKIYLKESIADITSVENPEALDAIRQAT